MEARFAGLGWRFAFADEATERMLRERYSPFAGAEHVPALRTLDLSVRLVVLREDALARGDAVALRRTADSFVAERLDFRASVDLATGRADVDVVGIGGMQSALRVVSSLALARLGGALVHASSVVRGDRAFVFIGESGAGKTTIARLSAPSRILSDEVSAIVPAGEGAYACHATPFWGELANDVDADGRASPPPESPACAPLARVLFPRKAARDALVPVSRAAALVAIAREAFVFGDDEPTARAISDACAKIAGCVPAAELHFRKTSEFWSLLELGSR